MVSNRRKRSTSTASSSYLEFWRYGLPAVGAGLFAALIYVPDLFWAQIQAQNWHRHLTLILVALIAVALLLSGAYLSQLRAFPSAKGDFGVVGDRLPPPVAALTGSALLFEYVLTVAVSLAVCAYLARSLWPQIVGYEVYGTLVLLLLLAWWQLRPGVAQNWWRGPVFWLWIVSAVCGSVAVITGLGEDLIGPIAPGPAQMSLGTVAALIATGALLFTGFTQVATGGSLLPQPKRRYGLVLVLLLGCGLIGLFLLLLWASGGTAQFPLPILLGEKVAGTSGAYLFTFISLALLLTAASTAFHRFTRLAEHLADAGWLPHQLTNHNRIDSLRIGVNTVTVIAAVLLVLSSADLFTLLPMYLIGAFTSVCCAQISLVRWAGQRARQSKRTFAWWLRRMLHAVAAMLAVTVLISALIANFYTGALIAAVIIFGSTVLMLLVHRHYRTIAQQIEASASDVVTPAHTHGVILVAQLDGPTMRAIMYASANRHHGLTALNVVAETVAENDAAYALAEAWADLKLAIPLVQIPDRNRDLVASVLQYVRDFPTLTPRDILVVYVPEFQVSRWWHRLLHNTTSARLRNQLLGLPGVVTTVVPWHLNRERSYDNPGN